MNQTFENDDQVPLFPLEFDKFSFISHCILIIFGTPLNMIVVLVILSSQRLKNKPRNILFLGIVISSLFSLVTIIMEIIAHHFESPLFCKMTGLILGVPYTCILKNLLLALLDRYLAITRPLLHLNIVTVRNVRIIQIIGVIVIFFFIKWPFIFGVARFQCNFLLIEAKTVAMHQAILIILCVLLYILVFFKTRQFTRPNRLIPVFFPNQQSESHDRQVVINITQSESDPSSTSATSNSMIQPSSRAALQMHGGSHRMEIEATFTVLAGVLSLLIFSAPLIIAFFIDWGCHSFMPDTEKQGICTVIVVSMPYLKELLCYYLVYNPIQYMIRSKEFSSTLTEKWARIVHHRSNSGQH